MQSHMQENVIAAIGKQELSLQESGRSVPAFKQGSAPQDNRNQAESDLKGKGHQQEN